MEQLLDFREKMVFVYKKFESMILFFLKFIVGFFMFDKINSISLYNASLKNYVAPLHSQTMGVLISLLLALFFCVMPTSLSYFLMIILLTVSITKSFEVAFIVLLFLTIILFLYANIATKESLFIIFTIMAFYFKIPYLIPIIAGLYFSLTVAVPIGIGIFIWESIPIIKNAIETNPSTLNSIEDIGSIPERFFKIYALVSKGVFGNQVFISQVLVFTMIIVLVYIVSKLSFDYSKDVSIVLGGILNVVGLLIVIILLKLKISVLAVIFFTAISVFIALIISFFDNVLDYPNAENVEFEDKDFYYYVRVIPKTKSKNFEQNQDIFKDTKFSPKDLISKDTLSSIKSSLKKENK